MATMTKKAKAEAKEGGLWRWLLGLLLLAVGTAAFELANVPYYAMLRQVSTPKTIGRVSGIGWACGYFGGIVLLLLCNFGFIAGDGPTRGFLNVPTEGGLNIRLVALFAAAWFAISALPVLFLVPELPADPTATPRRGSSERTGTCSRRSARCGARTALWCGSSSPPRCSATGSLRPSPSARCSRTACTG